MDSRTLTNVQDDPDPGNVNGTGGTEDAEGFSPASKIAFEVMTVLGVNATNINETSNNFADLVSFFNANNLPSVAVQTTVDQLQKGDILQIKNCDSAFLIYIGKKDNGNLILEDLDNSFECSQQSFNLLFTGNAIFVNHTSAKMAVIDGSNVNDNTIHDSSISIGPMQSGLSTSGNIKTDWANAWQRQDFKDRAKSLVSGKTNNYDKVNAIFKYVRDSYNYDYHYTTKWSVNTVVNSKAGNCCELARMEYCLTKAAISQGLLSMTSNDYRFKEANCYFAGKGLSCGHVWVQFKVGPSNDPWQSADACYNGNVLGTHSGSINYVINYIYSSYLDW